MLNIWTLIWGVGVVLNKINKYLHRSAVAFLPLLPETVTTHGGRQKVLELRFIEQALWVSGVQVGLEGGDAAAAEVLRDGVTADRDRSKAHVVPLGSRSFWVSPW